MRVHHGVRVRGYMQVYAQFSHVAYVLSVFGNITTA
jgi:hypothetical protein